MKKGQSEMVGFALIIVIVSVILLIFLSVTFKKSNEDAPNNEQVGAFVQAFLSYTTDCEIGYSSKYYNVQRLILACGQNKYCIDERNSCDVLNETLEGIIESSWKVGGNWPTKGYLLNITLEGEELISFYEGNQTSTNKGYSQVLDGGIDIVFTAYS